MSSGRIRAITGALAPSAVLLAIAILGLFFDTYWQYVFAISITAAVIGSALAMLVGYARCITIATGAMLAIGAYGATIPVVHGSMPFLAAVATATLLGACAGWALAVANPDVVRACKLLKERSETFPDEPSPWTYTMLRPTHADAAVKVAVL